MPTATDVDLETLTARRAEYDVALENGSLQEEGEASQQYIEVLERKLAFMGVVVEAPDDNE